MNYLDSLLANAANRIAIVSGEGEKGNISFFTGRRTRLAVIRKLNKERCNGDRLAYAIIEASDPKMAPGYAVKWSGGNDMDDTFFPVSGG